MHRRQFISNSNSYSQSSCKMASFITTMYGFLSNNTRSLQPPRSLQNGRPPSVGKDLGDHDAASHSPLPIASTQSKNEHNDILPTDFLRNARTRGQFKPRNTSKGTSSYQLRQFAEATLGSGSLRKAVKLPDGEDINEWLAVNGKLPLTL